MICKWGNKTQGGQLRLMYVINMDITSGKKYYLNVATHW